MKIDFYLRFHTKYGEKISITVNMFSLGQGDEKKSKGLYWLLFFAASAALAFAIYAHWPWLTLIIPFVTTFFVLAADII